jgi:hypothetical protein
MGVFLSAQPGMKADLFFSRNRHFQPLLEGRKDGTEFRVIALLILLDLAPQILVGGQQGWQVNGIQGREIRTEHYSLARKKAILC